MLNPHRLTFKNVILRASSRFLVGELTLDLLRENECLDPLRRIRTCHTNQRMLDAQFVLMLKSLPPTVSSSQFPPPFAMAPINLSEKTDSGREYRVKDISLADYGRFVIGLAEAQIPSLMSFRNFGLSQPFKDVNITGSLHLTTHSAVLIETFTALGAEVGLCSCNTLSTQDHAAAAMARDSASVFAWKGETPQEYWWCTERALDWGEFGGPDILIDDGGDAILLIHEGVKAEEEYQKTGKVLDLASSDNPQIQIRRGIIRDSLMVDPNKYHKMKDRLIGVAGETTTVVKRLYQMHAEETAASVKKLYQMHSEGPREFPAGIVNDFLTINKESSEYMRIGSCFACGDPNHWKDEYPWVNLPCPKATCMGQMKILTSSQFHHLGRKFLRCKIPGCSGFKWLDDGLPTEKNQEIPETSKAKERLVAVTRNKVKISFKGNAEDVCKLIDKLSL